MKKNHDIDNLCFFPYIGTAIVAVFFLIGTVSMSIFSLIVPKTEDKIIFAVISFLSLFYFFICSIRTPLRFELDSTGIAVRNVITREYYFAKWTDFYAAYCMYGPKGHTFMLLARTEMDHNQQKECWKNAYRLKFGRSIPSWNGNVIFWTCGHLATISRIIEEKIIIVDTEQASRVH